MLKSFSFDIWEGEYWYGGAVSEGLNMPICRESTLEWDCSHDNRSNQLSTLFLSSKGRVLWLEQVRIQVEGGVFTCYYEKIAPILTENGSTLKDAYAYAKGYFHTSEKLPPKDMFVNVQFNDWMEVGYDQSEENILRYARDIIAHGYPCSVLMIDDKWSDYYGHFQFNGARFPNPQRMIEHLHEMGFKVMLWETPFISPDCAEYRELVQSDLLVKTKDGKPYLATWWNGVSAVLDLTKEDAVRWLDKQNAPLLAMGVDGFKFDAGDINYYPTKEEESAGVAPEVHCAAYSRYAERFDYCELRADFNGGGRKVAQRLADKHHAWGMYGLKCVISDMLLQNLLGYWYACPDMVGGGSIGTDKILDEELYVRFAQASALMPMMQFSSAPWRKLSKSASELCLQSALLHCEFGERLYALAQRALETGEPIVRYLAYEFPEEGLEKVVDKFMLGEDILVCPVTQKKTTKMRIYLPKGSWQDSNGTQYEGGKEYFFKVTIETLLYFTKIR